MVFLLATHCILLNYSCTEMSKYNFKTGWTQEVLLYIYFKFSCCTTAERFYQFIKIILPSATFSSIAMPLCDYTSLLHHHHFSSAITAITSPLSSLLYHHHFSTIPPSSLLYHHHHYHYFFTIITTFRPTSPTFQLPIRGVGYGFLRTGPHLLPPQLSNTILNAETQAQVRRLIFLKSFRSYNTICDHCLPNGELQLFTSVL